MSAERARRARVAHVTTVPEFVQYIMMHDLRRLQDRVDATIFCSEGPGVDAIRAAGFRVITIPIRRKVSPFADVIAVWVLWRALRRGRYDVVHSWVPKGGLVGQVSGWLARVPVRVHSCRGLLYTPDMSARARLLYSLADRLTNGLATRTLFNSSADREYAAAQGLCAADKARYTGSGIDLSYFRRSTESAAAAEQLRRERGIPAGAPMILTVGRYVVEKGYRDLLAAAAVVHRNHPGAHFVWVAPAMTGEAGTLGDDEIERAGLADVIHRVHAQQDVRPYYAMASMIVQPTYREGVPRVLMEAAAMGVPIIASDIPGCREVVRDGETGLLVPARAPDAIARAIDAVLAAPAAAAKRAAAAEADVRRRFDQDLHAAQIWRTYEELQGRT